MATYTYQIKEDTQICHYQGATEKDYGMQCIIIRKYDNKDPQFEVHNKIVSKLAQENEGRKVDVVFIHVAQPGLSFDSYAKEKVKLPITMQAYFKILQFFAKEYPTLQIKMDHDMDKLKNSNDWLRYSSTILLRRGVDILYKQLLDSNGHYLLYLTVLRQIDSGKTQIKVAYSEKVSSGTTMGNIVIPPDTCLKLSKDYDTLSELLDYKESNSRKRKAQSDNDRQSRSSSSEKK